MINHVFKTAQPVITKIMILQLALNVVVTNALFVQTQKFALLVLQDNYFRKLFARKHAILDSIITQDHALNVLLDVQTALVILPANCVQMDL